MQQIEINTLYQHKTVINHYCHEFMKRYKLAFFGFLRCTQEGHSVLLSNQPEVFQYLIEHEYPLTSPTPHDYQDAQAFHYLVPEIGPYQPAMHAVAQNFSLFNPFDIVYKHPGYYEMFCFGINKDDFSIASVYLNHLKNFELFCQKFKKDFSRLITSLTSRPIYLSEKIIQPVRNLILPESNDTLPPIPEKTFALYQSFGVSKREIECVEKLRRGFSAKQIAQELNISNRTVEKHLENARYKLSCTSKYDLVRLLD